jgi:HlyD family secretion protein
MGEKILDKLMVKKILKVAAQYKIISGVIIVVVIFGGYFGYTKIFKNNREVRYATAQVQKGTLIVSVSGSGQVSASNQIDIKPKVSGDVVYIGVKNGQEIKAGTLIAQLDATDAQKAVRDAEVTLESARLALEKLNTQYEQQLRGDTLNKSYEDGLIILARLYDEFPTTLDVLKQIFFGEDLVENKQSCNVERYHLEGCNITYYASYSDKFTDVPTRIWRLYLENKKLYQRGLADYQSAERGGGENRGKAIESGYELVAKTAELVKLGRDVVRSLQDSLLQSGSTHTKKTIIDRHESDLTKYEASINNYLKDLLTIVNTINNQRDTLASYPLDKKAQELTIKQRENALLDAKEKLEDYFIRAPFDGIIAKLDAKEGDAVSPATILGTLITKQKIAEVSLNEIDAAKVKVGQEAILTFDAFPELEITGKVIEISTVGTEEQGVVSYDVKVSLEKEVAEIKAGMTVNAKIFAEKKENALLVPNSAIKSDSEGQYVEIVKDYNLEKKDLLRPVDIPQNFIEKRYIKAGNSNEEFTEVLEGLKEGEVIIVKTLSQQVSQNRQQTNPFLPRLPFGQRRQ